MYSIVTEGRVQIKSRLTDEEVHELLNYKALEVIQFQSEIEHNTIQKLNDILFSVRDDIVLRLFGFTNSKCDVSFLKKLPNLSRLYLECYEMVENLEAITSLKKLKELSLSIYGNESFDILSKIPDTLEELVLDETKSKKPDLTVLERFKKLRELVIVGHTKNIKALGKLENLECVTLTSVTTKNLEFLFPLKKLWNLTIHYGGIKNFSAIEGMNNIKYLELSEIRGLADISFVSTLLGLQYLSLQNLRNIEALPPLNNLNNLKKVALNNMKGLKEIESLGYAPSLVEFTHWSARNMNVEDYVPLLRNTSLDRVSVGFGSNKKNFQFENLVEEYGKTTDILWHDINHFNELTNN
ncbi:hypothetical protein [Alkalihalobacillus trypoxylicola]|uniref:Internalin n=1 Tax=Alkalihalobacillus trypoxylicola TaxID=519424 RepID=A0A161PYS5_9BACI|nr:hypothetical protein [Alkalihalobacillus trypoxylicola]KYG27744.1 hypothetical protein AZF04_11185 [Alkalihalobacillus trypoxylicola]